MNSRLSLEERIRDELRAEVANPLNARLLLKELWENCQLTEGEVRWRIWAEKHFMGEKSTEDRFTRKYFRELIKILDRVTKGSYSRKHSAIETELKTLELAEKYEKSSECPEYAKGVIEKLRGIIAKHCENVSPPSKLVKF